MAVTSGGDVFVTGTYQGKATFGSPALSLSSSSTNDEDVFVYRPKKP